MSAERRKYKLSKKLTINNITISEVIIDPHVDKHSDHITDDLVISLVHLLDGKSFRPVDEKNGFNYYVSKLLFEEKIYRLVWLQQNSHFYIGVITAFKEKGEK